MTAKQRWTLPAVMTFALLLPVASIAGPPNTEQGGGRPKNGDNSTKKKARPKPSPKNLAIKAMRMVIEEAVFKDMTFEEFTEWLSRTTKANVVVQWKILEKVGVERDCPIQLKRKNVTIRKLLPLVFDRVTEDLPTVELAVKADGNTLIVSTRAHINTKRFARVYDVQDLLISVPNFKAMGTHEGHNPEIKRQKRGLVESKKRKKSKTPPKAQLLIDLILKHIQPLSWKVNGGKGTIVFHKGKLVVYNNIEVHQQIGGAIAPPKKK